MRWNSPSPVENHTAAPSKITVRTAPRKAPRTQEYTLRDFPGVARGAGSFVSGVLSIVIYLPELQCKKSRNSSSAFVPIAHAPATPKGIHTIESLRSEYPIDDVGGHGLRFARTRDRMIYEGLEDRDHRNQGHDNAARSANHPGTYRGADSCSASLTQTSGLCFRGRGCL